MVGLLGGLGRLRHPECGAEFAEGSEGGWRAWTCGVEGREGRAAHGRDSARWVKVSDQPAAVLGRVGFRWSRGSRAGGAASDQALWGRRGPGVDVQPGPGGLGAAARREMWRGRAAAGRLGGESQPLLRDSFIV